MGSNPTASAILPSSISENSRLGAGHVANPEPEPEPIRSAPGTIRCNNCDWTGGEEDLWLTRCVEDGEWCRACPTCGTDGYLMDLA